MALRVSTSRNDDNNPRRPAPPRTVQPRQGIGQVADLWDNLLRQATNFAGDVGRWFEGKPNAPMGRGAGDYIYGLPANSSNRPGSRGSRSRGGSFGPTPMKPPTSPIQENTPLPGFLSNLMEALGYVSDPDPIARVSYDPLRQDARNRQAEYDAHLAAMYKQLQGSIRDDGTALQGTYDQAIDDTAARAEEAQAAIQGASDAAAARNLQQLQALGIGEAAGNIVAEGRDLNSQTADQIADAASRGQISGDLLQQNAQSAQQHNTNLVGAAGLEGNSQRARLQNELSQLLAQYDMAEQQANQQIDAQNQQMRSQAFNQALGLAEAITGNQWDQRRYQDELSRFLYEQELNRQQGNQPNKIDQSLEFIQRLMSMPRFQDKSVEDLAPIIDMISKTGKLF